MKGYLNIIAIPGKYANAQPAGKQYRPKTGPGKMPASIETLAERAADHYRAIRRATPAGVPVRIHVFPVKRGGTSARFRTELAQRLFSPNDRSYIYARERASLETRLEVTQGFIFTEVDPADYEGSS